MQSHVGRCRIRTWAVYHAPNIITIIVIAILEAAIGQCLEYFMIYMERGIHTYQLSSLSPTIRVWRRLKNSLRNNPLKGHLDVYLYNPPLILNTAILTRSCFQGQPFMLSSFVLLAFLRYQLVKETFYDPRISGLMVLFWQVSSHPGRLVWSYKSRSSELLSLLL